MNLNNINYEYTNNSKKYTLVLLHGWGQNLEMMKPISNYYIRNFNILNVDLPGFGKSKEPTYEVNVYDYVYLIHNLIVKLNIKNVILIGHSFGGKISLLYASKYKTHKLICLASPYKNKRNINNLKIKILKKLASVKFLDKLKNFAKNHIGSNDYKKATPILKKLLVSSINMNIASNVKKIKCQTLLVWGDKDTAVPINNAYELNRLIKNSGVVILKNGTHYAYLEQLNYLITILDSFLKVGR